MDTIKLSPKERLDAAVDALSSTELQAERVPAIATDTAAKTGSAALATATSPPEREARNGAALPLWSPELLRSLIACCLCSAALQSARGGSEAPTATQQQRPEGGSHSSKREPDVAEAVGPQTAEQQQHYACVQCGSAAGDWSTWPECLAHLVREHASCIYRCDLCQSVFLTQLLLELHFRAAHLHLVAARTNPVPFPSPSVTTSGAAERASASHSSDVDVERSSLSVGSRKRKLCSNEKISGTITGSGANSDAKYGDNDSQEQQPAELSVVRTIAESLRDKCSYCGLLCDSELALLHHQMREHRFDSSAAVGERQRDAESASAPERAKRSSIEIEPIAALRVLKRKRSSTSAALHESL